MRIEGTAVVTGGASGIGAACCRELAARGATVVALDRDIGRAEAVAAEIGGRAWSADVADENAMGRAAEAIETEIGPVEMLVNSAGVIQRPVRPTELTMVVYDDITRVDQRGTLRLCVAFGRPMLARRRGAIVNVASVAGMRSMPLHAYGPAKAARDRLTRMPGGRMGAGAGAGQLRLARLHAHARVADGDRRGERDPRRWPPIPPWAASSSRRRSPEASPFSVRRSPSAITGVNLPVDCGWLVAPSWHTYGGLRGNARPLRTYAALAN